MQQVPMTEAERLRLIIDATCGGNQRAFSDATGLNHTAVNKILHSTPETQKALGVRLNDARIIKICKAFPQVNAQFLRDGTSYPGDITPELTRASYEKKLAEKEELIRNLLDELNLQRRIIDNLLQNK